MKKSKYEILSKLKKIKKNKLVSNLGTLNKEKTKIKKINDELKEMLDESKFVIGETLNSGSLRQVSSFRKNLQEKIDISKNRATHLSKEIDGYLGEINKVNKQQEKINEKIRKEFFISEKTKELKESTNFKVKSYQ
ncbi:MAG: hypothetical protein CMM95_01740 [Rickettsiales bacterium]|nr:hypothetical protein [Rickettsiales bacterium]